MSALRFLRDAGAVARVEIAHPESEDDGSWSFTDMLVGQARALAEAA